MSFEAMIWAVRQELPAPKKCLLIIIANNANVDGAFHHSYDQLAKEAGLSRRSVIVFMKEFEAVGYIAKEVRTRANKSFTTNEWKLVIGSESPALGVVNLLHYPSAAPAPTPPSECPAPALECGLQDGGSESPALPSAAPAPLKTIKEKQKNKSNKNNGELSFENLPGGITEESARAFADHRKILKKPLSQHALDLAMREAARAPEVGWEANQAIDEAIMAGWQGIKIEWLANRVKSTRGLANGTHQRTSGKPDIDWEDTSWADSLADGTY